MVPAGPSDTTMTSLVTGEMGSLVRIKCRGAPERYLPCTDGRWSGHIDSASDTAPTTALLLFNPSVAMVFF